MVADIDERMPADEFWGWMCYLDTQRGKDKQMWKQPKTADGWLSLLEGMGHEVPK